MLPVMLLVLLVLVLLLLPAGGRHVKGPGLGDVASGGLQRGGCGNDGVCALCRATEPLEHRSCVLAMQDYIEALIQLQE